MRAGLFDRRFNERSIPGLQWFVDFNRDVTLVSTKISAAGNLSGTGFAGATQATDANRPTLLTNQVNGLPAASFDGTASYMNTGLTVADFFDAATKKEITVAMLLKTVSGTATNQLFGSETSTVLTSWVGVNGAYVDGQTYWDPGNATNGPTGARTFVSNNYSSWSVGIWTRSGSTASMYKNNTQIKTATVGTTFSVGTSAVKLGASHTSGVAGAFTNMLLARVAVWNAGFDAAKVAIVSRAWGADAAIVQA
jgi:hypothetical protein